MIKAIRSFFGLIAMLAVVGGLVAWSIVRRPK